MKIFGFSIQKDKVKTGVDSPVAPQTHDPSIDLYNASSTVSPYVSVFDNISDAYNNETDLITKYRELSTISEVDTAVQEIAGEAIVIENKDAPVKIDLDGLDVSDNIKNRIISEFDGILNLLNFNKLAHDIFKRWYIDGKIYYYCIVDPKNTRNGIVELRLIDPRRIRKYRKINTKAGEGYNVVNDVTEFYVYSSTKNFRKDYISEDEVNKYAVIQPDAIVFAGSGIFDTNEKIMLSHLYKAIRPATNKKTMEESMMIYRLARASEKRIHYVDVGNLSNVKAEQYIQELANKHKSKIAFDPQTGEIRNDKRYLAITEDYWLPRKEGSNSTEVSVLEGGQNLGETGEAEYFKTELIKSLNVPMSRFSEEPSIFSDGSEITRDEVRFNRFISLLRTKFNVLFEELLMRQLVLKRVMSKEDFDSIKSRINFVYTKENNFSESLKLQQLRNKIGAVMEASELVGTILSIEYVYKNILNMTDAEIELEKERILEEQNSPQFELLKQSILGIQEIDPNQEQ